MRVDKLSIITLSVLVDPTSGWKAVMCVVCHGVYSRGRWEGAVWGLSWWKAVPGEQSTRPCQASVIFKVSTDRYWDELPFSGTKLNRGGILRCVVLQHNPERFSQCSLLFAQKWTWQGNFPLHPLSPAHGWFKALLTQHWFEWFVYTVGLCLLLTIQSFWWRAGYQS